MNVDLRTGLLLVFCEGTTNDDLRSGLSPTFCKGTVNHDMSMFLNGGTVVREMVGFGGL